MQMKTIKNIVISAIAIAAISYAGYSFYLYSQSPCDKPLEYSIGRFDTQFGITEDDFKSYVSEAGTVWEKTLNRKIFIYNPKASFKINLIYDQRQLATIQKQKTEFGLSAVEDVFKKLDVDFSVFKSQYDQKSSNYEQALASFSARKAAYDAEVAVWNSKGGAPKNQYQVLDAERLSLNAEAQQLNAQALSLNDMAKQLNTLLIERNAKAAEYNKIAEDYNKKYNQGLEFNQAEYISGETRLNAGGGQVNVYQFGNKRDLILALSHELGHALGMDHVENPKSIMYYLTGINADTNLAPTTEDLAELNRVCK